MGSKGSTGVELNSEKTGVREKTPEVPTSSKPARSEEKELATLRCASAGASACAGVGVGAGSCAATLKTLQSIRPWTASRKVT